MNHVWWKNMASRFSYDSAEEDWDIRSLQFVNSQLEKYLNMVRINPLLLPKFIYNMCLQDRWEA